VPGVGSADLAGSGDYGFLAVIAEGQLVGRDVSGPARYGRRLG
jgi:hypothetical protein